MGAAHCSEFHWISLMLRETQCPHKHKSDFLSGNCSAVQCSVVQCSAVQARAGQARPGQASQIHNLIKTKIHLTFQSMVVSLFDVAVPTLVPMNMYQAGH